MNELEKIRKFLSVLNSLKKLSRQKQFLKVYNMAYEKELILNSYYISHCGVQ